MMSRYRKSAGLGAVAVMALAVLGCQAGAGHSNSAPIPAQDIARILDQAEASARKVVSLLRVDASGKQQTCRMHIMIVDRDGEVVGQRSMPDAWVGSISIAKAKAFTALAFSSNENALTTRSLGPLTQPGGPLWNIGNSNRKTGLIEFPGGMPLYRGTELIGGIGVSGDGVDQDEEVAAAGARGFEAPKGIRIDTVTKNGVPYTK
jgi:glc operon protein GlcG